MIAPQLAPDRGPPRELGSDPNSAGHRAARGKKSTMADRAAKRALYEEFAAAGKVLGHPARLELIDLLAQGCLLYTSRCV